MLRWPVQLDSFLEQSASRHPERTALVCGTRRLTYGEIDRASNRLAHALIAEGLDRGDRVVIWLDNSIEAVLAVFAVLRAGGVFVLVNPTTKADKLAWLLNHSRARALVAPAGKLPVLEPLWERAPHLETVVVTGSAAEPQSGWPGLSPRSPGAAPNRGVEDSAKATQAGTTPARKRLLGFDDVLARADFPDSRPQRRSIDVDLAALIYTSGSTGGPKGVMLTHHNMVAACTSISSYLGVRGDDVILDVLPLSFDYGLYQVLMAFQVGARVVLERSFAYPHAVLQGIVREGVTGLPIVPTIAALLLQLDLSRYDFSTVRYLTNTAAALPLEHVRRLRALLPHVAFFSMYGLTECKRVAYLPPDQIDLRPGSVGRAMPNVEAYVVDEDGRRVPPGVVGELVVRGSNVMLGYWECPEETARRLRPWALVGERVLHTGDLFRCDDEGYLYFVGRKDDIIKSRGEKVSPREVEDVLCAHPAVAEAAVVGVPDPVLGQAIKAFVVLKPGATATAQEVRRHCAERLEDFLVPQLVELRDALPRSDNGKIDRRRLSEGA